MMLSLNSSPCVQYAQALFETISILLTDLFASKKYQCAEHFLIYLADVEEKVV